MENFVYLLNYGLRANDQTRQFFTDSLENGTNQRDERRISHKITDQCIHLAVDFETRNLGKT